MNAIGCDSAMGNSIIITHCFLTVNAMRPAASCFCFHDILVTVNYNLTLWAKIGLSSLRFVQYFVVTICKAVRPFVANAKKGTEKPCQASPISSFLSVQIRGYNWGRKKGHSELTQGRHPVSKIPQAALDMSTCGDQTPHTPKEGA